MILETRNLNKSFGGIVAARDISLSVEENQVHAVVGPNGAGKTTLVSQLTGILRPDTGEILFEGKDITHTPVHRRVHLGLARSFQVTSIILPLTLLENVSLAVQSLEGHSYRFWSPAAGDQALQEKSVNALATVGLDGKANTLAGNISHGEQRQLEIAMALALKPRLLLLDEPMAGMSREETGKAIRLLQRIKQSCAILLIEHDMDAVFALADAMSVLVDGQVIDSGSPEAIRENPEVQKAYLGES